MAQFSELIEAQLSGATVRAAPLVDFDFKSGPERLWQGTGLLDAGGHTWKGTGALGAMSPIQAGPRGAVEEITLSLFGDAGSEDRPGLLDKLEADSEESTGRACNVYLQFFDIRRFDEFGNWVDWQPLGAMISMFWGVMGPLTARRDRAEIDKAPTRVVSVPVQNALINRQRPAFAFFSHADQLGRTAGAASVDNIFLRIPEFSEGTVRWPNF